VASALFCGTRGAFQYNNRKDSSNASARFAAMCNDPPVSVGKMPSCVAIKCHHIETFVHVTVIPVSGVAGEDRSESARRPPVQQQRACKFKHATDGISRMAAAKLPVSHDYNDL
jgi:hypothetical protein